MNRSELMTLLQLQKGAKIVAVRFTQTGRDGSRYPSRQYHFKSAFPLKPGDLVVVEHPEGFRVGSVDEVGIDYSKLEESGTSLGDLRHVVGVVDLAAHASVKMEERRLLEIVMQAELQERMKGITSNPLFQALMAAPTPALDAVAQIMTSEHGTRFNAATGEVLA